MITDGSPGLLRPRALEPGDLVVIASLSGPLHARYAPDLQTPVGVQVALNAGARVLSLLEPAVVS